MDKYIRSLPYEIKKMTSHQNPASLDELVNLVESHMVTADLLKSTRPDTEWGRKGSGEATRTRRAREPPREPEEAALPARGPTALLPVWGDRPHFPGLPREGRTNANRQLIWCKALPPS